MIYKYALMLCCFIATSPIIIIENALILNIMCKNTTFLNFNCFFWHWYGYSIQTYWMITELPYTMNGTHYCYNKKPRTVSGPFVKLNCYSLLLFIQVHLYTVNEAYCWLVPCKHCEYNRDRQYNINAWS